MTVSRSAHKFCWKMLRQKPWSPLGKMNFHPIFLECNDKMMNTKHLRSKYIMFSRTSWFEKRKKFYDSKYSQNGMVISWEFVSFIVIKVIWKALLVFAHLFSRIVSARSEKIVWCIWRRVHHKMVKSFRQICFKVFLTCRNVQRGFPIFLL